MLKAFCRVILAVFVARVSGSDTVGLPPLEPLIAVSPHGTFRFQCQPVDGWKTSVSVGTLHQLRGRDWEPIWTHRMPHRFRPRFALVTDAGLTTTFDDWDNGAGPRAISVFSPQGKMLFSLSFETILDISGIRPQEFLRHARAGGWWLTREPWVDASRRIQIAAGDRLLTFSPESGALEVVDFTKQTAQAGPVR
jgi:hypothetical protein